MGKKRKKLMGMLIMRAYVHKSCDLDVETGA